MSEGHPQPPEVDQHLARIEGHVRGIRRMVNNQAPCEDLLLQIGAVRSAIDKTGRLVLENHLETCVHEAAASGNAEDMIETLKTALLRYAGRGGQR